MGRGRRGGRYKKKKKKSPTNSPYNPNALAHGRTHRHGLGAEEREGKRRCRCAIMAVLISRVGRISGSRGRVKKSERKTERKNASRSDVQHPARGVSSPVVEEAL